MGLVEEFNKLQTVVVGTQEDVTKCANGNASAATRVRKAMQDVKNTAQDIRKAALEESKKK